MQNYGSWSPFMVKEGRTCLGLEYFVNEGDGMWTQVRRRPHRAGHARALPARARRRSVERRGRLRRADAEGLSGLRRALPGATSSIMRKWLAANTPNVFPCGRNGMHKYNNQDHSMFTAMLSVENILGARPRRVVGQRRGRVPRAKPRRRVAADRPGRSGAPAARARRRGESAGGRLEGGCHRPGVSRPIAVPASK